MFKRIFIFTFILITCSVFFSINAYAGNSIDTSNTGKGYVTVTTDGSATSPMVAQVKFGATAYNYVFMDNASANLPLQFGKGSYSIMILQKVTANKYKPVTNTTVSIGDLGNTVFTNSIQLINYNSNMQAVKDLNALLKNNKTDAEKVKTIHEFVVNNFKYDFDKAKALSSATNYIPNVQSVYVAKKGICYDMSAIFATALRDNNIPTKLIMGYTPAIKSYHAWNQVYIDGKWQVIDTTYDVGVKGSSLAGNMFKKSADYSTSKYY